MENGTFEVEDQDIVRLDVGTFGWVNIGAHAVRIGADNEGNLTVEVCPRENEGVKVGDCDTLCVSDSTARERGGINPDGNPGACILTGAEGENAEDCTTHEHEPEPDTFTHTDGVIL